MMKVAVGYEYVLPNPLTELCAYYGYLKEHECQISFKP